MASNNIPPTLWQGELPQVQMYEAGQPTTLHGSTFHHAPGYGPLYPPFANVGQSSNYMYVLHDEMTATVAGGGMAFIGHAQLNGAQYSDRDTTPLEMPTTARALSNDNWHAVEGYRHRCNKELEDPGGAKRTTLYISLVALVRFFNQLSAFRPSEKAVSDLPAEELGKAIEALGDRPQEGATTKDMRDQLAELTKTLSNVSLPMLLAMPSSWRQEHFSSCQQKDAEQIKALVRAFPISNCGTDVWFDDGKLLSQYATGNPQGLAQYTRLRAILAEVANTASNPACSPVRAALHTTADSQAFVDTVRSRVERKLDTDTENALKDLHRWFRDRYYPSLESSATLEQTAGGPQAHTGVEMTDFSTFRADRDSTCKALIKALKQSHSGLFEIGDLINPSGQREQVMLLQVSERSSGVVGGVWHVTDATFGVDLTPAFEGDGALARAIAWLVQCSAPHCGGEPLLSACVPTRVLPGVVGGPAWVPGEGLVMNEDLTDDEKAKYATLSPRG